MIIPTDKSVFKPVCEHSCITKLYQKVFPPSVEDDLGCELEDLDCELEEEGCNYEESTKEVLKKYTENLTERLFLLSIEEIKIIRKLVLNQIVELSLFSFDLMSHIKMEKLKDFPKHIFYDPYADILQKKPICLSFEELYVKYLVRSSFWDTQENLLSFENFRIELQSNKEISIDDGEVDTVNYISHIEYVREVVRKIQIKYEREWERETSFKGFRHVEYQTENASAGIDGSAEVIEIFEFDYESIGMKKPDDAEYFGISYTKYVRGPHSEVHIEDYEPLRRFEKEQIVIEKWVSSRIPVWWD
tara:strand:+ start:614 stop:1522 length:909 start_codon:yes stop_codon:yes gene_type:complete